MTHPIDTAYVDIVPVDKSLVKLQRDIDKAMKKIDKEIEKDLKKIDKDFDDTFAGLNKYMDDMEKDAGKHFRELENIVDNSLGDVETHFDHTFRGIRKHFTDLGDDSDRSFRRMRSRFLEPFTAGLKSLGGVVSELGRAMFQLVSGIGGSIISNPLMSLIIALIPAIIALSGALIQLVGLVGLVPAGLSVLLATILPVVVAFHNFGDAVSAVMSGDLEKMDEALKKLAPSARTVALEIGKIVPQLKAFQLTVQNAFFAPLQGAVTALSKTALPSLENGFLRVAQAMGKMIAQVLAFLSLPEQATFIDHLFRTTASLIDKFGPNLVKFMIGFIEVANAALPTLLKLGNAFSDTFGKFGDFMTEAARNGSLQKFIDDALATVHELFDLVKALASVFGTLFSGTEESGHDFIKSLTEMTIKFNEFLKSADGQDIIQALVFAVKVTAATLSSTLAVLILFTQNFKMMLKVLRDVGEGFVDFVVVVGKWFAKIPEFIGKFIAGIPEMVARFFTHMFDLVLGAIGVGIGLILFAFQVLPGKIADFLTSLPQRIYDILVKIGPLVATAIQMAVDFGRNILVNGFNSIVEFIASVPDRIKSLIPTFGGAGKNLIESFMNGFRSVGHFIGDVAGDIVNSVKGFLNKAIDKINAGIAKVDEILPGDLGRIPRLAAGALVRHRPGGIMANIGEGNEDEVVAPLSKLEGIVNNNQAAVNFGPNSINVNFSGVVPTEQEARNTGNAVGQGIIDMITRRNMRVQVRAV